MLNEFGELSCQCINFAKSGIILSRNAKEEDYERVYSFLVVNHLTKGTSYLGLPFFLGRSIGKALNYIIERIRGKLKSWKQKILSQARREILIKSIVQVIPYFIMSCFLFPIFMCRKMDALIRSFWWGGDGESSYISWKNWVVCTNPKVVGGLGFRDFRLSNLFLLAKQGWRLLTNPGSFWAQYLKALYYLNFLFIEAKLGYHPLRVWVFEGKIDPQVRSLENVGFVGSVDIWKDPWVPR